MKKSFIDLCKSPSLLTFFVSVGVIGLFEFVIWPGLTASDTLLNIFCGVLGVLTLGFVFYFVKNTWLDVKEPEMIAKLNVEDDKEPETELDYNPTITKGTKTPKDIEQLTIVVKSKPKTKKPKKNGTNKVGLK
jgi:hypothetical protein